MALTSIKHKLTILGYQKLSMWQKKLSCHEDEDSDTMTDSYYTAYRAQMEEIIGFGANM